MRIIYIRANNYDATPAIPRALEAGKGVFEKVTILAWDRHGFTDPLERELEDGIHIRRFIKTAPPRSIRVLLLTFRFQIWAIRHLFRIKCDAIQAFELQSVIPAVIVTTLTRKRLIYDIRDPFAMAYHHTLITKHVGYVLDWIIMGLSSAFVLPNSLIKPYLGRWGRSKREVYVIPNTCHDYLAQLPPDPLTCAPKVEGKIRIAHMGYLEPARGSNWMFRFCEERNTEVEFVIAGLIRSEEVESRIRSSEKMRFLGKLSYMDALTLQRDVNAVALLYDPEVALYNITFPTKFYESMMVGTPVLVSRGMASLENLIVENELGYIVDYGDLGALEEAVELLKDEETMARISVNCRQYYLDNLMLSKELLKYRAFYETFRSRFIS